MARSISLHTGYSDIISKTGQGKAAEREKEGCGKKERGRARKEIGRMIKW